MVSPLSVNGLDSPRSGPGSSYSPNSHDLAQPIVGMFNHNPRWAAKPSRRGWAIPWPSPINTSGRVASFLYASMTGASAEHLQRLGVDHRHVADAYELARLLSVASADVDVQLADLRHLLAILVAQQVDRLLAHHPSQLPRAG